MATITKKQAVDRLDHAIEKSRPDDLVEIYNELFPDEPIAAGNGDLDRTALVHRIATHVAKGLEDQEIVDLWNVIFPKHRNVWLDEEAGIIHYDERIQPVGKVD